MRECECFTPCVLVVKLDSVQARTSKFEVSIVEIGRRRTLQPGISSMDLGICDIVCCIDSLKVAVVQREYD